MCKSADAVELFHVSHHFRLVVVVPLDKDTSIGLVQFHFSPQNVHQPLVSHLQLNENKSIFKQLKNFTSTILMNFGKTGWRLTAMIGTKGHTSGIVTVDGTEEKLFTLEQNVETKYEEMKTTVKIFRVNQNLVM